MGYGITDSSCFMPGWWVSEWWVLDLRVVCICGVLVCWWVCMTC